MLSRKWSRERFLARCCDGEHEHHRKKFDTFSGKVYEGRWGSVMDSLADLLPIKHDLRKVWDKERFGQTKRRDADDEDVHGSSAINVDVVDAAIRSRFFWSYGIVVDNIGKATPDGCRQSSAS